MTNPNPRSRASRLAFGGILFLFTAGVALVIAELALRVFPIPGIAYHSFYYDPVTGGKYYPHTTLIFRGEDGTEVRRRSNNWGFPDRDHETAPAPGTLRIGFFGDSYTEALQVDEADMFVRRVEEGLNDRLVDFTGQRNRRNEPVRRIETLGFGVSGRGPLQSYLECREWMRRADLDWVVYVFVENDPADQVPHMKQSDIVPYPTLSADTFVVDDSFNDRYGYKTSWWHRAGQRLKSNSLVVSTLEGRLKLLMSYGVKRSVTEADRKGEAGGGGSPMAPSAWPADLVPQGWDLVERVVDRWSRDVGAEGRRFAIVRVPREEPVIDASLREDTWGPRLAGYCARRGIPLADPTDAFAAAHARGVRVYHHHFTPEGHEIFAHVIDDFIVGHLRASQ